MGGGSAGAVSYPSYMQTMHHNLINLGTDAGPAHSVVEEINSAYGNNPYSGAITYNPDNALGEMAAALSRFTLSLGSVQTFNPEQMFTNAYGRVFNVENVNSYPQETISIDESAVNASVNAYSAELDDRLENVTLPSFRAGMLNINATNGSAFIIGESLLRAFKGRDVARYSADLREKLQGQLPELTVRLITLRREINSKFWIAARQNIKEMTLALLTEIDKHPVMEEALAKMYMDFNRMKIIAKTEQLSEQLQIDQHEVTFRLDLFGYANSSLGSIGGGGGGHATPKKPSAAVSALGGAVSGAATGAAVGGGNPYAVAAGAVIGAGLALATR